MLTAFLRKCDWITSAFPEIGACPMGFEYPDQDGDGAPSFEAVDVVCGEGVASPTLAEQDCDDSDGSKRVSVNVSRDFDDDGYASGLVSGQEQICVGDEGEGWATLLGDCGWSDPTVYPGAPEVCDGVDHNCDGFIADTGDLDGDGVANGCDNCPEASNPDQLDWLGDGEGDVCDDDDDNDGALNEFDNCPDTANADQKDSDTDGLGDACDKDADNDGVDDPLDNCLWVPNKDQLDTDMDDVGDECDPYPYCPGISIFDALECDGFDRDGWWVSPLPPLSDFGSPVRVIQLWDLESDPVWDISETHWIQWLLVVGMAGDTSTTPWLLDQLESSSDGPELAAMRALNAHSLSMFREECVACGNDSGLWARHFRLPAPDAR
jgi:hypothetical protein